MRQPLTPLALASIAGIVLANASHPPLFLLITLGFACLVSFTVFPRSRPLSILFLTASIAALRFVDSLDFPYPNDLRSTVTNLPAIVSLRGILSESPSLHSSPRKDASHLHSTAFIDVLELKIDHRWIPSTGRVQATLPGTLSTQFFRSQSIEVEGVLKLPNSADAPGLFDHASFLFYHNVHRQLVTDGPQDWRLTPIALSAPPLSDHFLAWGRKTLARGLPQPDPILELIWAMTLGWHPTTTQDLESSFLLSGTIHVFAISGLHIALICMIFVALLRTLRLPRAPSGLLALPAVWAYVAITGWQPSAIRSALMMSVIIGGWALQRPGSLLNSLAGACLGVLAWQPGQLFLAGFQLSFGAVASLALLSPPLLRTWELWTQPNPLVPVDLLSPFQRHARTPMDWLGRNLSSSTAAWLGSCPLVWHYFHLFNPVSLAANLVVIPLSSAALVAALASLLCGDWLPVLGEIFNASAWVWMSSMVLFSQWFATLPSGWCHVAPIPIPLWIAYYALLLAWANSHLFPQLRRWTLFMFALSWLAALGLWKSFESSATRLTLLPGGSAVWMDLPGSDHDGLINGGDESSTRRITLPFLHAHGINRLPHWLITQAHIQFLGGAPLIQDAFRPLSVSATEPAKSALQSRRISQAGPWDPRRIQWVSPGTQSLGWTLLHPPSSQGFRGFDDASGVLIGDFEGVRILYCGTLSPRGQRALLQRFGQDLRADIAIAGIPNEGEPLIDPLLDVVQPHAILLLNAHYPVGRRGSPDTFERFQSAGYPWMSLIEAGSFRIEANSGRFTIRAFKTGKFHAGKGSATTHPAAHQPLPFSSPPK